jgi:stress-induced morphogen
MINRALRIQNMLTAELSPLILEIEDESHMHSGPNSETHFKILIVSAEFEGISRIDRQRRVNKVLEEELKNGLHALTQRALSPTEWNKAGKLTGFISPPCAGAPKK